MKRALIAGGILLALAAACGFPTVQFNETGGDEAGSEAAVEAASDEAGEEAGEDASADVPNDYAFTDIRPDVILAADIGPDAFHDPCDEDNDTFKNTSAKCGGTDCDDFDLRANPGIKDYASWPDQAPTHGDWDCSGHADAFYPESKKCGNPDLSSKCTKVEGFNAHVVCGFEGDYIYDCVFVNALQPCKALTEKKTQLCK